MFRKLLLVVLITILILSLTGCDELIDTLSKDENNIRIISLSSNQTEILIALGLDENIIGLNSFDKYFTEDIEKIGDVSGLDIDRITQLNPDLIVDYNDEFINDFRDLSLNYISFSPNSIDSIKENILNLGQHTNTNKKAKDLVDNIDDGIQKIKSILPGESKNVVVETWHDPSTFAKANSYIGGLIGFLDANLSESVADMDVYIAYDNFPERRETNEIFLLDKDLTIPGINVIDALKELYNIIY